MSIENNKIFEEFWRNFEWPEPAKPLEYRLYYDSTTGDPLFYSTAGFDKPYIVLTQQVYNKYDHNVFVKDEKKLCLIHMDIGTAIQHMLKY